MKDKINHLLDVISAFLAYRKGLLPLLGLFFILLNWVILIIPGTGWLAETNTFLHIGLFMAIIGFMIAWAL